MRPKHFCKLWSRITQNLSKLHGKQLCCETQKSGKCAQNFFINLATGEFPKYVWTFYMLWPENGFNRENMSCTSLKKYLNWVLWNSLQWRKLRPKNASADFQNFCRLASEKGAKSAVFFGWEGTLPMMHFSQWNTLDRQLGFCGGAIKRLER